MDYLIDYCEGQVGGFNNESMLSSVMRNIWSLEKFEV